MTLGPFRTRLATPAPKDTLSTGTILLENLRRVVKTSRTLKDVPPCLNGAEHRWQKNGKNANGAQRLVCATCDRSALDPDTTPAKDKNTTC